MTTDKHSTKFEMDAYPCGDLHLGPDLVRCRIRNAKFCARGVGQKKTSLDNKLLTQQNKQNCLHLLSIGWEVRSVSNMTHALWWDNPVGMDL